MRWKSLVDYIRTALRLRRDFHTWGVIKLCMAKLPDVMLGRTSPTWPKVSLRLRGLPGEIRVRMKGSDISVLRQVFADECYRAVLPIGQADSVVDLGANVGYASLYFWRYLNAARLVAVEPDPMNAAACRANLQNVPIDCQFRQAAVWSRAMGLMVERGTFRDGRDWAVTVRPAHGEEVPVTTAIDVGSLLDEAGLGQVDLLKIDIEGAERELFAEGASAWLGRVRNLVIELHDEQCVERFERAMAPFDFDRRASGDAFACLNIRPRKSEPGRPD